MSTIIYHNARCSKSRAALAILEENNLDFEIIRYLETPPQRNELEKIIRDLEISPRDLLRKGEKKYKELGLGDKTLSNDVLLQAMLDFPILIERPIVRTEKGIVIGRPTENVLTIL